jgi:glucosylglycerate synthase
LADESVLTDDFIRQLINVGEVDILVGLPTHNNAKTVEPVIKAIQAGILKSFIRERAVILNVDGGSKDGTPDVVTGSAINDVRRANGAYTLRTLPAISTRYAGAPSAKTALHTLLAAAELLRAKACAVISAESTNIDPEWIPLLLRPIYQENFDFVAPIYRRHKFEGLLVSNLMYPMTRAIYGQRIREPYATEFGFSGNLATEFLGHETWRQEPGGAGPEMQLTLTAITGGYRIHQAFLGAKGHTEQATDLVHAMRQTVGVLFSSLDSNFTFWSSRNGSQPIPTTGPEYGVALEPTRVNRKRLRQMFIAGVAELEPVLKSILSPPTLSALQQIAKLGEDDFQYPAELWTKTVYEFAAAHHKSVISRDHIIQALAPLYRGRAFTFLAENRLSSADDVENYVESLCREFERLRPYLLEHWNGGK